MASTKTAKLGKAQARRGFDAWQLARTGAELSGELDAHALPRVEDRLQPGSAPIRWRVSGTHDESGRPAIVVDIRGKVPLECQRCLGKVEWPVEQTTLLLLARDERELAVLDGDSEHEVVLAKSPLDPVTLVEDELTLTLPFAPRHADDGCALPAAR
jgi:uncharacterized protein